MFCRQFEDSMRKEFGTVDKDVWRRLLIREEWDELPASDHTRHLSTCSDCMQSLLQFFEVQHFLQYEKHPCFHVAYYSADIPDRCLDLQCGMYSIITSAEKGEGIVIGFCPWCGTQLPVGLTSGSSGLGSSV
jgi:hypothetical protein